MDGPDGPLVGRAEIGGAADWNVASVAAKNIPAGVHDLVVTQAGTDAVDVDWVSFR